MIDPNRLVCYCNDLTVAQVADIIKRESIGSLAELVDRVDTPMGDKCEACLEEGYEHDGCSLAMVLSLVKQNRV